MTSPTTNVSMATGTTTFRSKNCCTRWWQSQTCATRTPGWKTWTRTPYIVSRGRGASRSLVWT